MSRYLYIFSFLLIITVVAILASYNKKEKFTAIQLVAGTKGEVGPKGDTGERGLKGDIGIGIASITNDGATLIITSTDGQSRRFTIPTLKGDKGDPGNVIADYDSFTTISQNAGMSQGWVVNATSSAWDPVYRGNNVGLAHTNGQNDDDTSAEFIDFNVPQGVQQAYVVHLPWSSCRYFDILGITVTDQSKPLFIKRVNAWHNVNVYDVGGSHSGASAVGVAGVNRFTKIRIQGRKGRIHLMGVGWTREQGRDMETGFVHWDNVAFKPTDLATQGWVNSTSAPQWSNIQGRPP
jgi:hypothetical protein